MPDSNEQAPPALDLLDRTKADDPSIVTGVDTFRIGNIGDIQPRDIERSLVAVGEAKT